MIGSQPYSISMNPTTHFLHHKIFHIFINHNFFFQQQIDLIEDLFVQSQKPVENEFLKPEMNSFKQTHME